MVPAPRRRPFLRAFSLVALACSPTPPHVPDTSADAGGPPAREQTGDAGIDAGPASGVDGGDDAGLVDAGQGGGAVDAGPPASVCARYPGTQVVTAFGTARVVVGPAADGKGRLVGSFVARAMGGRVASASPSVVNFTDGRVVLSPTACDFEGTWALRSSPMNAIATFTYAPNATWQVELVPGRTYSINVEFDRIPGTVVCNSVECNWLLEHR